MTYEFRLVDHHQVMHYAWGSMRLGEALCGYPPIGNKMSDPSPNIYPPRLEYAPHNAICVVCQERRDNTPPKESK